jgi:hypothetical protein
MKKYVFRVVALGVLVFCLAGISVAQAAGPYLVCDPYAASVAVTSFTVFWDGATTGISAPVFTDATGTYIHLDLSTLANGAHTVKVRANNQWGQSADSLPFAFTKTIPTAPLNLRISAN